MIILTRAGMTTGDVVLWSQDAWRMYCYLTLIRAPVLRWSP